ALRPWLADAMREQHERARDRAIEDLGCALFEHHRRDRAKLLAALDVVQALEVGGAPRIGEQAAMAERAGAVLAASLEPGHDAVVGEHLRHLLDDVVGP